MSRIEEVAESLLRDGSVDNEPNARLAAVHILLAREWTQAGPPREPVGTAASSHH